VKRTSACCSASCRLSGDSPEAAATGACSATLAISGCEQLLACMSCRALPLLADVQMFFADEHSKGRSYADLYELVQHAGNVLPRL
jgi:hypothetical protein